MNAPADRHIGSKPFAITVDDLGKRFNREWIFRHLHFQFVSGQTYAVTGPNGSGKSTLLQVLWGQLPQSAGSIAYRARGEDVAPEMIFRHVSIATPYMDLIDEFTLEEMLAFHFKLRKVRADVQVRELPGLMYLEEARGKQLINFSSGMKQRLKLAMALYTEADAFFLDEPGTNLDSRAFSWYREELAKLPKTALVVIASNNAAEYPSDAAVLDMMDFKR